MEVIKQRGAQIVLKYPNKYPNNSKIVTSANFQNYVPDRVTFSGSGQDRKDLLITEYVKDTKSLESYNVPATSEHIIGLVVGGTHGSKISYQGHKWQSYTFRKGSMLLGGAYSNNYIWRNNTCLDSAKLTFLLVHLSPQLLTQVGNELLDIDPAQISLRRAFNFRDPLLEQLILGMKAELTNPGYFDKVYWQTATQLLSVHLLKYHCKDNYRVPEYQEKLALSRLRPVIEYIQAHPSGDLSLAFMAELAGMTPFHFSHAFKKTLGIAPHQYIISQRIEKAKALLKNSHWPIKTIALEMGYKDASKFSLMFKRKVGLKPSDYRKNVK